MNLFDVNKLILLPEHRKRIGIRVWVYLFVIANPNWTPRDAAISLDMRVETVKSHARFLAVNSYIPWKDSFAHGMRRESIGNEKRWDVWNRDHFTCLHCGSTRDLTIDHVIPVVSGGTDDLSNLQTLCRKCNSRKGSR